MLKEVERKCLIMSDKNTIHNICKMIEREETLIEKADCSHDCGYVTTKIYTFNNAYAVITMINGEYISLIATKPEKKGGYTYNK